MKPKGWIEIDWALETNRQIKDLLKITWKLAWNSHQLKLYCILRNNKIYTHRQIWLEASGKRVD